MNIHNIHQMIVLLKSSLFTPPFSRATATARAPAIKKAAPAAALAAAASTRSTSIWDISWPRKLRRRSMTECLTKWETNVKTDQSLNHLRNNYSLLTKKMNDENINKKKNFINYDLIVFEFLFLFICIIFNEE